MSTKPYGPSATLRRAEFMSDHAVSLSRDPVREGKLSIGALGLLWTLSTHRVGWQMSEKGLATQLRIGPDALRSLMAELEEDGYLVRMRERVEGGRWGETVWIFTDYREVLPGAVAGFLREMDAQDRHFERQPARTRASVRRKRDKRPHGAPAATSTFSGPGVPAGADTTGVGPDTTLPESDTTAPSVSGIDPDNPWEHLPPGVVERLVDTGRIEPLVPQNRSLPSSEPFLAQPHVADPHVAGPGLKGEQTQEGEGDRDARARNDFTSAQPTALTGQVDRVRVTVWAWGLVTRLVGKTLVRGQQVTREDAWRVAVNCDVIVQRIDSGRVKMSVDELEMWLSQDLLHKRTLEAKYKDWAAVLLWRSDPEMINTRSGAWLAHYRDSLHAMEGEVESRPRVDSGSAPWDAASWGGDSGPTGLTRCAIHDRVIEDRCEMCEAEVPVYSGTEDSSPWGDLGFAGVGAEAGGVEEAGPEVAPVELDVAPEVASGEPEASPWDFSFGVGLGPDTGTVAAARRRGRLRAARGAWDALGAATGEVYLPDQSGGHPQAASEAV